MAKYDESIWEQFESVDEVKVQGQVNKFKLDNKDEKARVAFPLVNPKTKKVAMVKVLKFQYSDKATGSWATFQAPAQDTEAYKVAVKFCGEPQVVYVTPILVYSTNKDGRIINGEEYTMTNLTLPKQRLQAIKALQDEYDLAKIDLIVTCEEPKFQKMQFTPAKECGLIDGEVTYSKDGKQRKVTIDIDMDEVLQEAIDMSKESALAVAPHWGEQYIIDYFSGDQQGDTDFDDDEDEEPAPKKREKESKKSEPESDIDDDDGFDDIDDDEFQ